ncbi:MAG: hypothetical protein M3506_08925, partial [Chloroflexota bacterium]|nr:hypothetical protein [Chloroflexota bacterium]
DHSPAFWSLTREVCPEIDRAEAFLAGVSWLAGRWEHLPPVERALLTGGVPEDEAENGTEPLGKND